MAPGSTCAISIDVDPIPCYYRIHALGPAPAALRLTIMERCVPRFAELLESRGLRGTFFIVAEDLDAEALGASARAAQKIVRDLFDAGHEIASHSHTHPYELARLPKERVAEEIGRAHTILSDAIGQDIVGFRAPGYDISADMMGQLIELGYQYDSSIFPAPGYYAAKAVVLAGIKAIGRKSGAVMTNPRALLAPANPYRPRADAPWRRGDAPLWELPIAVTPLGRTPAIGTSLLTAPAPLRRHWIRAMRRRDFFNFELHGIDLCDADVDGIPGELVRRQPDLRRTQSDKAAALSACIDDISRYASFETLAEKTARLEA